MIPARLPAKLCQPPRARGAHAVAKPSQTSNGVNGPALATSPFRTRACVDGCPRGFVCLTSTQPTLVRRGSANGAMSKRGASRRGRGARLHARSNGAHERGASPRRRRARFG